jgi:hypothetical protein
VIDLMQVLKERLQGRGIHTTDHHPAKPARSPAKAKPHAAGKPHTRKGA